MYSTLREWPRKVVWTAAAAALVFAMAGATVANAEDFSVRVENPDGWSSNWHWGHGYYGWHFGHYGPPVVFHHNGFRPRYFVWGY